MRTLAGINDELIAMAYAEARKRIEEGTATSQLLTAVMKEGTVRAQLEHAKLENENALLAAKCEAISAEQGESELYAQAIAAFTTYTGRNNEYDKVL